jgi:5-formyltetrahydrofolate cyclo-ligase
MLKQRQALDPKQRELWNRQLCTRFLKLPEVLTADMIYCYISYGTEIDTRPVMQALLQSGKRIAAPRVDGREMTFYEIRGMEDTIPGFHGIPEPDAGCKPAQNRQALILMPGLAFTKDGDRMGYGGGFYDRFLAREPEHPTVALAYPFQMFTTLPTDTFDHRIDRIILPGEA